MSQKKVDAYKAEKANREKIMKREKLILNLEKLAALVVCIVAVCWIGYSVYGKVTEGQETVQTETVMDTSALDSYLNGLSEDAESNNSAACRQTESVRHSFFINFNKKVKKIPPESSEGNFLPQL